MRPALAILLATSFGIGSAIVIHEPRPEGNGSGAGGSSVSSGPGSHGRFEDFQRYDDEDYAFSLAVPGGWDVIVAMSDDTASSGEGYAVGFEAPRDGIGDRFAEYVMVEILPGDRSGRFVTDGSQAQPISVGGLHGVRERLAIDRHDMGDEQLDLVVIQAEVSGLGFTLGFYAIGEPSRRPVLESAFELMIRTFELDRPPFRIS